MAYNKFVKEQTATPQATLEYPIPQDCRTIKIDVQGNVVVKPSPDDQMKIIQKIWKPGDGPTKPHGDYYNQCTFKYKLDQEGYSNSDDQTTILLLPQTNREVAVTINTPGDAGVLAFHGTLKANAQTIHIGSLIGSGTLTAKNDLIIDHWKPDDKSNSVILTESGQIQVVMEKPVIVDVLKPPRQTRISNTTQIMINSTNARQVINGHDSRNQMNPDIQKYYIGPKDCDTSQPDLPTISFVSGGGSMVSINGKFY
jgi:hypothetical protein